MLGMTTRSVIRPPVRAKTGDLFTRPAPFSRDGLYNPKQPDQAMIDSFRSVWSIWGLFLSRRSRDRGPPVGPAHRIHGPLHLHAILERGGRREGAAFQQGCGQM